MMGCDGKLVYHIIGRLLPNHSKGQPITGQIMNRVGVRLSSCPPVSRPGLLPSEGASGGERGLHAGSC